MELADDTTLHPTVEDDPETDFFNKDAKLRGGRNKISVQADAVVYKNIWAGSGSLSIEVIPTKLRVLKVEKMKAKDLHGIQTAYNL